MQSLRTRRSQPQRQPTKLSKPGGPPVRRDTRGKSRVDDKMKKRLSMRYAEISSPTEVSPSVPPVPSIPRSLMVGIAAGRSRVASAYDLDNEETTKGKSTARDDKKLLDADDFDPAAFLKIKLANSTEAELKSLQSSLVTAKQDTAADLQRTVFKNYAEFVLISKEISTLENELMELKESLSEYKNMPSLLHIPDPTSISSSTLSTYKRSSVADLRIMYFNQMQALHTSIEGAAKFAPTTPGRHVVSEMEGILSLNAATYKVTGKVKFVILDDMVLVAKRRRRNAGNDGRGGTAGTTSEGKLVAERCWLLNEMLVLDTKDSSAMTNVFKIRHGKETHVYRTESSGEKKGLLSQLRHVAEELAAKKRKEREGEHERRKSMWHGGGGGDRSVPPLPEWMADLARKGGDIPGAGSSAKGKAERDARWTNDWADELTVAISLREWTKAVGLVEKAQEKVAVMPPLAAKLPVLTSRLIAALLDALSKPTIRKSSVVLIISLLTRLDSGTAARNTLLCMRSQVIKSHIRKIQFEGNIMTYIGELAVVCFTGIKNTADWFLSSFKENEVASSFIDWAKKEIEHYAEIFRRQVFTPDMNPQVIKEAVKVTHSQSKKLLQEYGLDFTYLFNELLVEKPKDTIKPDSTFRFNTHNRLSRPPDQFFSSSSSFSTPVRQSPPSPSGRRTPTGFTSPTSDLPPPVPALPSYLRPRQSASTLTTPSKPRSPPPDSGKSTANGSAVSLTSTSSSSTAPSISLPLASPSSPNAPQPFSASTVFASPPISPAPVGPASIDGLLSPSGGAGTNKRTGFAMPSRNGARTPIKDNSNLPSLASTMGAMPMPNSYGNTTGLGSGGLKSPTPPPTQSSLLTPGRRRATSTSTTASVGSIGGGSVREREREREQMPARMGGGGSDKDRLPRALRPGGGGGVGAIPATPPPMPPMRSANRPGSNTPAHRPPPVAVPQREGMF
ncbi:hypothetical protein AMATHDRAFT_77745 [Amanita thiersii Skay4041]|uniref:Exocyst complex component EXO84 n=1 Tax=Amanita thiersii Skay4041 TaxID=703135 RepID=A0A2A9NET0_9AGAR|nr:hypothetical protein AMATHDRAFT_77745 [Amanita thiersii Skay4041]